MNIKVKNFIANTTPYHIQLIEEVLNRRHTMIERSEYLIELKEATSFTERDLGALLNISKTHINRILRSSTVGRRI